MLSFDIETVPFTDEDKCPEPVYYSWGNEEGFRCGIEHPAELLCFNQKLVGCNTAYDMACMYEHAGWPVFRMYDQGLIHDIAIREQLMDIAKGLGTKRSYGLAAIVERRFGVVLDKSPAIRNTFHIEVTEAHEAYAKADAEWTWKVWYAQEQEAEKEITLRQNLTFEYEEVYAAFCLHLMEIWGIRADKEKVDSLMLDANAKYAVLCQKRAEIGVLRPDGTVNKKVLQQLVFEAYNSNPPRTDKGGIKTDRLTLEESGNGTLQDLVGDGPIEKIITTYGSVIQASAAGVYTPRYHVLGAASGRASGNFQQWPRGGQKAPPEVTRLRACFRPRAGRYFCSVDLEGAELVSLAQVCFKLFGYSKLRDAINAGQNIHTALAASFMGVSYEEAAARVKSKDKQAVDLRQAAKPVNFGLPGLMGAQRLVWSAQKENCYFCELAGESVECIGSKCQKCVRLAYRYIATWKKQWPEVPQYHAWIQKQSMDPFVTPLTGWVRGSMFPSEASNQPFQHLTSRAAKRALVAVTRACYDEKSIMFGAKPSVFAHDEVIAEVLNAEQGEEMARIVREAAQEVTPDVIVRAEPALMLNWFKGADTKRDEQGKLILWTP